MINRIDKEWVPGVRTVPKGAIVMILINNKQIVVRALHDFEPEKIQIEYINENDRSVAHRNAALYEGRIGNFIDWMISTKKCIEKIEFYNLCFGYLSNFRLTRQAVCTEKNNTGA